MSGELDPATEFDFGGDSQWLKQTDQRFSKALHEVFAEAYALLPHSPEQQGKPINRQATVRSDRSAASSTPVSQPAPSLSDTHKPAPGSPKDSTQTSVLGTGDGAHNALPGTSKAPANAALFGTSDSTNIFRKRSFSDRFSNLFGTVIAPIKEAVRQVPALDAVQFATRAQELFDRIDTDRNHFLSTKELAAAMQDKTYKDQDAQVVAALYNDREDLTNRSGDEWFWQSKGISKADLKDYHDFAVKQYSKLTDALNAEVWLNANTFAQLDGNHNGSLTMDELDRALNDKSRSDSDKQMLGYLKEHYSGIESANFAWKRSGIAPQDIKAFATAESVGAYRALYDVVSALKRTARSERPTVCMTLFADASNPLDSIKPEAIKQGYIGDCYFVGALQAVATSDPQLIAKMIKDNGNGSYTVTFPGAEKESITVTAPTQAEMGLFNAGSQYGIWPGVLEKAYGAYLQRHEGGVSFNGHGNVPEEGADGGGDPADALQMLTGHAVESIWIGFHAHDEQTIKAKLIQAFSANPPRAVAAGTSPDFAYLLKLKGYRTPDGFPEQHAYGILAFDANGADGGTITIRNPWGAVDETPDGEIQISLHEFLKNFSDIEFEQDKAAPPPP